MAHAAEAERILFMKPTLPSSLKEERTHGSELFRFGYYTADTSADSFFVAPHWHEEIEIVYFQKGHFILEANMERYPIDSEAIYFIRSGELHRIFSADRCVESAVVFSPYLLSFLSNDAAQSRLLGPLADTTLLLPRCILPTDPCYRKVLAEYRNIVRQCNNQDGIEVTTAPQQIFIKAALLNILGLCAECGLLASKVPSHDQNVEDLKRILSYIHAHYTERIYIRDLAGLLNLNEQYFCRMFKKAIGQSPMAYVNAYRIRRACTLLRDTTQPVTDICLECGFSNFGNFLREFRKQTGLTPLKYRQKSRS